MNRRQPLNNLKFSIENIGLSAKHLEIARRLPPSHPWRVNAARQYKLVKLAEVLGWIHEDLKRVGNSFEVLYDKNRRRIPEAVVRETNKFGAQWSQYLMEVIRSSYREIQDMNRPNKGGEYR